MILRRKCNLEAPVRVVMSLCESENTKLYVDSKQPEEFEVNFGVHRGYVSSPLLFYILIDVVSGKIESLLFELMYTCCVILINWNFFCILRLS